jgi:hypothetical protein
MKGRRRPQEGDARTGHTNTHTPTHPHRSYLSAREREIERGAVGGEKESREGLNLSKPCLARAYVSSLSPAVVVVSLITNTNTPDHVQQDYVLAGWREDKED